MSKMLISYFPFMVIFLLGLSSGKAEGAVTKKILAIIAGSNFRDEELSIPSKIFKDNGYQVIIASSSARPCRGMLGAIVTPDILLDNVNVDDYDAIVFVGGEGSAAYWDDPAAHKVAKQGAAKNKIMAAICIAPVTLANAGVLSGKRATVWHSEAKRLTAKGALYTGLAVEEDGNIITANSPSGSSDFAKAIIKVLKSYP